jgi:hypothetical protein
VKSEEDWKKRAEEIYVERYSSDVKYVVSSVWSDLAVKLGREMSEEAADARAEEICKLLSDRLRRSNTPQYRDAYSCALHDVNSTITKRQVCETCLRPFGPTDHPTDCRKPKTREQALEDLLGEWDDLAKADTRYATRKQIEKALDWRPE